MRITNSMMTRNYMNNLNGNAARLSKAYNQMETGKRIFKLSDDPIGMATSLAARSRLNKIGQYSKNIQNAKSWLDAAEASLSAINEAVGLSYERVVQISNGTYPQEERNEIAVELEQYRDLIISTLNDPYGDRHLFGGYNVGIKPVEYDGTDVIYNGINMSDPANAEIIATAKSQKISYEIDVGEVFDVSVTGAEVLEHDGVNLIDVFNKAINELRNPSNPPEYPINDFLKAQNNVLRITTEMGAKQNRLDLVLDKFSKDESNYDALVSNIEGIDIEEASVEFSMAQYVYEASLAIGTKIIQPSLLDFLR